jgi:hypothetical protein
MPIINIKLIIEKELENGSFKHYLNSEDFEVYSTKEDEETFSIVAKKPKQKNGKQ